MTLVIAVLLGLILVAMISSNQAAAAGVWKVVRIALGGIALLVAWGVLVGYVVWYYEAYPKGEWERIIGISVAVILPPTLLWTTRKAISEGYKKDKKAAFKLIAVFIAFAIGFMVVAVVIRELQAAYEYSGWLMVVIPLAFTSVILLWRSLTGSKGWSEVWFGPPPVAEPWQAVLQERLAAESSAADAWAETTKNWAELTEQQQNALEEERRVRFTAMEERLHTLSKKLEAEKAALRKDGSWTVMGFFWLFVIFAAFGLIGIAWDVGFAYAMELKFVKGKSWLAGVLVIGAGLATAGLLISMRESIAEANAKKP
jgi:uncharacterized membrane protein